MCPRRPKGSDNFEEEVRRISDISQGGGTENLAINFLRWRLNFVRWRLIFVGLQGVTRFMLLRWRPEF